MRTRYGTFFQVNIVIVLVIASILLIYTTSLNASLNVMHANIEQNLLNQNRFLVNSLDYNINQLDTLSVSLSGSKRVSLLRSIDVMEPFERIQLYRDLTDEINLRSLTESWSNQIAIYSPLIDQWIGTPAASSQTRPTDAQLNWHFDSSANSFRKYKNEIDYIIQLSFPASNIIELMDSAKRSQKNDPFLIDSDGNIIFNSDADQQTARAIAQIWAQNPPSAEGTEIVQIEDRKYMVSIVPSARLNWYLADFLPLSEALKPIERTKNTFYISSVVIFIAGALILLFLYRKIQVPLKALLKGVRLLRQGFFSTRIEQVSHNEFDYLFVNFNEMASQIEELIDKVLKEKIISREAMLKQLQAQINPHFLYNCLFFINNMVRLGKDDAATAMSNNLAEYFRYTTRLQEPMTTLQAEIAIIEKYLSIQSMRMKRLAYTVEVPDSMKDMPIPKLLIQPLVENSVIHGIERKSSASKIHVRASVVDSRIEISVEDDGVGMSEEEIRTLQATIKQLPDDQMGCALWNIQQRLSLYCGSSSGIRFVNKDEGGFIVTLYWNESKERS